MNATGESPLRTWCVRILSVLAALAWIAPLATRLVIGYALHVTGHGKLSNLAKVTEFFGSLGIPFPHANAVFVSTLEFVGGLCLIIGLGTRFFAFLLSCSLLVAVLTADRDTFVQKFPADLTDVTSFTFLLFLVWLVLYGPGLISIDHWIARRFKLGSRDNKV